MNSEQLKKLLAQYTSKTGAQELDDQDVIDFAAFVLAEQKRKEDIQRAREICLSGGGHFFSFLNGKGDLGGEIVYENYKTIISGWRGCDIKCDNCDAWLTIHYEEKDA